MKHKAVVIRYSQIEQRRLARYNKVKAVFGGGLFKAVGQLFARFSEQGRRVKLPHFVYAGNARGERHGAHPIRTRERQRRSGRFQMLSSAGGGHIISVCKRLAEADYIRFKAVIMVASRKVKAEACAHIVNYKEHTVLVAKLSYLSPAFAVGARVVVEISVVVGLCYQRGNVAATFVISRLHSVNIKPRKNDVVFYVVGQYSRIVGFHCPLVVAVVISVEEEQLFLARKRSRAENGKGRSVGSVLHKIRPIGAGNGIGKQLGALDHFIRRRSGTVAVLHLFECRRVNVGVAVAEYVRTVSAHKVKITVAVHIPKIRTLSLRAYKRPVFKRKKQSLRRAEMSVYARGDNL